jgi:delta-aminolevulinic acid dehydratase/porphobilinogen synthase
MANPPKIPLSTTSGTSTNPQHARDLQDQITLALLANGGIARIQTALRQRLDEAGWSENLREYVTQLFRSGECSTYFEAMEKVKARVRLEGRDEEADGVADGGADLVVPVAAAEGGVEAVRRELEGVCEMRRKEG